MLKHEFLLECIVILINILKIVKYFELKKNPKKQTKKNPKKLLEVALQIVMIFFYRINTVYIEPIRERCIFASQG